MRLPRLGIVVLPGTRTVEEPVSIEIVVDLKLENPCGRLHIQQPLQAKPQQLLQLRTIHQTTQRRLTGRPSIQQKPRWRSRARRPQGHDESEEFNRAAVDSTLAGLSQEPCDPTTDRVVFQPAPPPGPPPLHLLASQYHEEPMLDLPEDQHDKEGTGGNPRMNLQEMAQHLNAADEAALDAGMIATSFASMQLPSRGPRNAEYLRNLGVDLPRPVNSLSQPRQT